MITLEKNSKVANKVAAGVAALGIFAGVGLASAPAQAQTTIPGGSAGLSGNILFDGDPTNTLLNFTSLNIDSLTGIFAGASVGLPRAIQLTGPTAPGNGLYNVASVSNLLSFTLSDGSQIFGDLVGRNEAIRRLPPEGSLDGFNYQINVPFLDIVFRGPGNQALPVEGRFRFNGSLDDGSATYQITLSKPEGGVAAVPEPTTILGLGTMAALGMTTGLKRKKLSKA